MTDDQPHKRKMSKWIKIPLMLIGGSVVLVFLAYYTMVYLMEEAKGRAYTSELVSIAAGTYTMSAREEIWPRPARPDNYDDPTCSVYDWQGGVAENETYYYCTTLFSRPHGTGCSWWWWEHCDSYDVDDFILTQPDLLGRILHALREPCAYLPSAEFFQIKEEQGAGVRPKLRNYYKDASCATGGRPMPIKVVINVLNDHGEVIAQYKHMPEDRPYFTPWSD